MTGETFSSQTRELDLIPSDGKTETDHLPRTPASAEVLKKHCEPIMPDSHPKHEEPPIV